VAELVYDLLCFCNLVKFAKYIPSTEETEKSLNDAYDVVNMTKQEEEKEALVEK
jgi:hypothetical protein